MEYLTRQRLDSWDLKFVLVILIALSAARLLGWTAVSMNTALEIIACLLLMAVLIYMLQSICLKVKVNRKGIKIRHQWWRSYRKISWKTIRKIRVTKSSDDQKKSGLSENEKLKEFSGHKNQILRKGLEIELKDGIRIFVGLKHPENLDFSLIDKKLRKEKILLSYHHTQTSPL